MADYFNVYRISKNVYPYATLHLDTCGAVARAKYAEYLPIDRLAREDRADVCKRCMPTTVGENGQTEYHAGQRYIWRVRREAEQKRAEVSNRRHWLNTIIALTLELEEAKTKVDLTDPDVYAEYASMEKDQRNGQMRRYDVTCKRGY